MLEAHYGMLWKLMGKPNVSKEDVFMQFCHSWIICHYRKGSLCWPVFSFEIFQVLFDLFRHDVRLWKAYSTTLEVYLFLFSWCRLYCLGVIVYLNEQNMMFLSVFYEQQSHPAFTEYQDLLEDLEERLSSVANVEGKWKWI